MANISSSLYGGIGSGSDSRWVNRKTGKAADFTLGNMFGTETQTGPTAGQTAIADYQADYAAAKAANESRYQDILKQSEDAYTRNMGYLDKYGQQQSADINQRYSDLGASAVQDLTSRGLGNTTVTATTATGIANQASAEQRRLAEDLAQQRLAADTSLTQAKLGVMERKTDAYPDLNTYLQLAEYSNPQTTTKIASNYVYGGQSTGKASTNRGFDPNQLSNRQSMAYNY